MAITVTAQETGSTFGGGLLRVKVLTGAALAGTPATATFGGTGAQQASITTTVTGSLVYGAIKTSSTTSLTAAGTTTLSDNVIDSTNVERFGTCVTTATTGTPGPTTVGASAPSVGGQTALVEILAAGTIAEDGSAPVVVTSTSGSWVTLTTASFTPPPGSLLVAMVSADANGSTVVTVSGGSLTWTQRVSSLAQGSQSGYAGVWTAQIPGAVIPLIGAALLQAPAWHPGTGLPGLPGGIPFTWAQTVAPGAVPPPPVIIPGQPGTYSGRPGRAIPGLFIPGDPGPVIIPAVVTAAPVFAPAWHPGAGLPGLPGGVPFAWAQTVAPGGVPAAPATSVATATLAGAGTVTAVVTEIAPATPAAAGSVNGLVTLPGGGTLTGSGAVGTAVTQRVIATAAAAGSVTDAATEIAGAAVAGAAAVTDAVTEIPAAALAGAGSVTDAVTQIVTATLAGAGSVTANFAGGASTANLTAAASVTALATVAVPAAAAGGAAVTAKAAQAVTGAPAGAGAVAALATQTVTASPAAAASVTAAGGMQAAFQVARSAATVTDPRDGTATVTAVATSSPTVS